jgi:putative acetyltransferase
MQSELSIRPIQASDNPEIAHVIRTVMPEFGASGAGFAIHDPEVDNMFESYQNKAAYFVIEKDGVIVGGGGIAPLSGGPVHYCELKKMYFLPEARGKGMGTILLNHCLDAARQLGYTHCYLETFKTMEKAISIYHHFGFKPLSGPLGSTGHFSCTHFFETKL